MSAPESKNIEDDTLNLEDISLDDMELGEVSSNTLQEADDGVDPIYPVLTSSDENISLSGSELENIMAEDDIEESDMNLLQDEDKKSSEVALSDSELQNVLQDTEQPSSQDDPEGLDLSRDDPEGLDLSENDPEGLDLSRDDPEVLDLSRDDPEALDTSGQGVILQEDTGDLDFLDLEGPQENQSENEENIYDIQNKVYEDQDEKFTSLGNEYKNSTEFTEKDDLELSSSFPQSTETNTPMIENPPDFSHLGVQGSLHSDRMAEKIAQEEGLNIRELRRMILYLDQLFGKLPDDTVHEFSRSKYFDLYKKVIYDLGL